MSDNTTNTERDEAIKAAAVQLATATFLSEGYNPKTIGRAFADALMDNISCEEDLGQECLTLVIAFAQQRLDEHFDRIQSRKNTP